MNSLVLLILLLSVSFGTAYNLLQSRRQVFASVGTAGSAFMVTPAATLAFEGTGSSAYSGRTPATKAALVETYKARITADVKDFVALGAAIDGGQTDGQEWVNFFIEYQRREPDAVGRTYAARVDLTGVDNKSGAALLLASTFAKPNKPPDNLPQVKKYNAFTKTLDPVQAAGKAKDSAKAQQAWKKASVALSEYLQEVELPSELSDALYK